MRPEFSVAIRTCRSKNGGSGDPAGAGVTAAERVDDRLEVVRPDVGEELARLGDLDERSGGAQPETADTLDRDVGHVRLGDPVRRVR